MFAIAAAKLFPVLASDTHAMSSHSLHPCMYNLSYASFSNQEKFLQEEVRRNKGKKADDPFTRRSTKPRMVFKVHDQENMEDGQMMMAAAEVIIVNLFMRCCC